MLDRVKRALIDAHLRGAALIFRSYRNRAVRPQRGCARCRRREAQDLPFEAVEPLVNNARGKEGLRNGDFEHGVRTAGLVLGPIHNMASAAELIERIVEEARTIIATRLGAMLAA